ncbi:MAG: oligosaccharide flippase family protein, partial [Firmicutes bacterium]|nr:oligosaccharide flippase family protein [Bacillota bacterium]
MKENVRSGVIVNLIRTVTLTLLSFITFPFACKYLGDAAFGTFAWANTFVYYFLIIAKLGIPNIAIRECAKVRDDQKALNKKAQEFFLLQALFTLASFALMIIIIFSAGGKLVDNKEVIFILSINFIAGVFSFEWIYIALEKHFYISFRSIATITISAALTILFIRYPRQIYLYSFFAISGTLMTVIINLIYLRKYISLKKEGPYDFKQYFKPLLVIFLITIVVAIYNQSDSFILGYLDTMAQVGSYSVGIKGIEIVITIITSLSAVFIPRATVYYKMENKQFFKNLTAYSINICLFIALPAVVTMILLSQQVVTVVSGGAVGYANAQYVLIILASIMLTYSIGDIIYSQVLLPMNKEKIYLITMTIGAVSNIIGSILLGKFVFASQPVVGVAISTAATDVLILIFLIARTRQYVGKALFNWNSVKIVIAAALVAVSTYFLAALATAHI